MSALDDIWDERYVFVEYEVRICCIEVSTHWFPYPGVWSFIWVLLQIFPPYETISPIL